jgi:hypothetical protein
MELIVGSHGVMAGNAGNHLSGVGLKNFGSHRMGEIPLGFVALNADSITPPLQHRQMFATMRLMTGGAFFNW